MIPTSRERCIYCHELTWLVSRDGTALCSACRDRIARPEWEAQMEHDRQERNAATVNRMREGANERICPTCDAGDPTSVIAYADCECNEEGGQE